MAPGGTILDASCMRKGSNAWQSIIGTRDFILRGACWRVEDGKTIKVWKNSWLPENHHRKVLSPIPASLRNSCASELLLPPLQGWNIAMINQLFPPCDAKAILSIPGTIWIDGMRSAGYGSKLDKKAYYGFLKILCGIERIDHALSVFKKMKEDGCEPGIKTYDLLMGKLCAHNRVDRANALFNEAKKRGVPVEPKAYEVDPRYKKKKVKVVKSSEKKRETLPEKMARKRSRLKKIRLSFVKKPKRMMRRAY
uniref:Pentatricopeptide repeat-containing protein n=1 Tax=Fagus sylvatica TaxID=28930 RepID=A0A2N9HMC3_FAGSY